LFCFLDDHSRLLVGYRWAAQEDVLKASRAVRAGIAARGLPKAVFTDFVPQNRSSVAGLIMWPPG
jgi:putative transposase